MSAASVSRLPEQTVLLVSTQQFGRVGRPPPTIALESVRGLERRPLLSVEYDWFASASCRWFDRHAVARAAFWSDCTATRMRASTMAMIVMTSRSSTSVNARFS